MRTRILLAVIAIFALLAFTAPAQAFMRSFTMLELAEQSDVAFVGKVTAVAKDTAVVTIDETLYGKLDVGSVTVSPIDLQYCFGQSTNFAVGEHVLIFGKKTNNSAVDAWHV